MAGADQQVLDLWVRLIGVIVFICASLLYLVQHVDEHDQLKWSAPWRSGSRRRAIGELGCKCEYFLSQFPHLARRGEYHGLQKPCDGAELLRETGLVQLGAADSADEALYKGLAQCVGSFVHFRPIARLPERQAGLSQSPRPFTASSTVGFGNKAQPCKHPQVVCTRCRGLANKPAGL